uniref:Uncharacterized protein n=1 Tax=Rhizophora mucronata TaxID=61149 RepID=A0A2P2J5C2_RHIMU
MSIHRLCIRHCTSGPKSRSTTKHPDEEAKLIKCPTNGVGFQLQIPISQSTVSQI